MLLAKRSTALMVALSAMLLAPSLLAPQQADAKRRQKTPRRAKKASVPLVLRGKVDLAQRTEVPTFTPASPLVLMNRGTMLYLGRGLWRDQQTFYLLRLSDLSRVTVKAPFNAYVRANPGMLVNPSDRRALEKQFDVTGLLYYDEANQEAGFEVADQIGKRRQRRHFLMQWNLASKKVTHATLVARSRVGQTYTHMLPLGYDTKRREFSYVRQVIGKADEGRTIFVIAFGSGKPRVVAQFEGQRSMSSNTYVDPRHEYALLIEYAELASKGPAPRGHRIDLQSGKVRSFEIPLTTYGVAFDKRGQRIYAYSSQLGQLWAIDAASGRRLQVLRIGKFGHALGVVSPTKLLLLRNNGLRQVQLTAKGLRLGRFYPITRIYSGFSHVGGSLVLPGHALIKNGDSLYVVAHKPR